MSEDFNLKDLKNLKPFLHGDTEYREESDYDLFSREQLKAEAVKWLKSEKVLHMNAQDILLVLFNLTEVDLK